MPNQDDKLGALWAKSSERGDYFTGEIEINGVKTKLVVFSNRFKDDERKPDFIIYKSKPRT